ncbi:sensor histidine kinase [Clostridium sp. MCC353]|uniref:sensor histidine kinase n=1 Tax=Clostridium sp. MCC353 TaxID=2592646 RepID=UPI001C01138B|nr:sensor histidine kinase [Clostridium sp. MCC353]
MGEVDNVSANILFDKDLQKRIDLDVDLMTPYENYINTAYIRDSLLKLKNTNPNIDSIFLVDWKNKRGFSTETAGYTTEKQFDRFGWTSLIEQTGHKSDLYLIDKNLVNYMPSSGTYAGQKLLCAKRTCIYQQNELFTFYVNIDKSTIDRLLAELKTTPGANVYLTDGDFNLLSGTTEYEDLKMDKGYEGGAGYFTKDDDFYVYTTSAATGCHLISVMPMNEIDYVIRDVSVITKIILLVSVVLILFFGSYVYHLFYKPMNSLIGTMKDNESGRFTLSPLESQKDEFGEIGGHFNKMLTTVTQLNMKLYKQELLAKNARIKLLQSQINPHFLYNVLDTIHWMARMGKNDEVAKMTFALSNYYRKSLQEGREVVTISEAVELVYAYWDIIKLRFGDKMELIVDLEPEIENLLISQWLLQPLVENAVMHGFEQNGQKGVIIVSGIELERCIKLVVEDNGIGMSEKKLKILLDDIEKEDTSLGNFALRNINNQLKLAYGENGRLLIESREGEGTTITIVIPKKTIQEKGDIDV